MGVLCRTFAGRALHWTNFVFIIQTSYIYKSICEIGVGLDDAI